MIVEDRFASKRGPHHQRMGLVRIRECLVAEFVVHCIFGWQTGLDEAVPGVHVLVLVELLGENEIELIVLRAGELSTKKYDLVNPTRPKILSDLLERLTLELKTVLEGEVVA